MSLMTTDDRPPAFFTTVAGRLTLSYTLLFAVLSLGAFLLVYVHIAHNLNRQTDDRLRATIRELIKTRAEGGRQGLREEFNVEAAATGRERVFFRLLDPGGRQVFASDLAAWQALRRIPSPLPPSGNRIDRLHLAGHEHPTRVITARLRDGFLLQAGVADDKEPVLESYRETFSTAFLLVLCLGGIGAHLIARRAMGGVREVTLAAARIAGGDLKQSIRRGNRGEEIEALAAMFNVMQQRISALINELKGVINNVAHDLRMPITRMRGVAETTLTRDIDRESYRDMAVTVIEESERLVGQINTILELAEMDAGLKVMNMEQVDLARLVRLAVELYQPAAEGRHIRLSGAAGAPPFFISGHVNSLQRLLANLLDNAVKFTPAGGKITVGLDLEGEFVVLTVADNGPGIPPQDRQRIFDRFYRGDKSRSISGNGLGLALVRSIAARHNGAVSVNSDGKSGSRFVVKFPILLVS